MNYITFFNESNQNIPNLKKLKDLIKFASSKEGLNNSEFNIIFVNNNKIKELNQQYRKINKVTDVLAFALEDYLDIKYHNYRLLGDIYISIDQAVNQAIKYKHSLLKELSFLITHGFLHLLGYNHYNNQSAEIMKRKEEEILNEFNTK